MTSVRADQILQVWAIEKESGTVRPLIAFTPGPLRQFALNEMQWRLIKNARSLAISVEPATAVANHPTSALLYNGLCINLKGA